MIWLLANWKLVLGGAAIALLGVWLGVTKLELSSERTARAQERLAAAQLAADVADANRKLEAANAELTNRLDTDHVKALAEIDATRGDFAKRLADRVRDARSRCSNVVPIAAPDPGGTAGTTPRSEGGLGSVDSGTRLRDVGRKLQADVKLCVAWAKANGR